MEQYPIICVLYFLVLTLHAPITASIFPILSNKQTSNLITEKRNLKKALGYNEDTFLNFTELATKYNYPTEVHSVTTEDGYKLTIFRMLSKCSDPSKSYPVLLVHGILDTSDTWIVAGTTNGLAYVLANNCYDVWAANNRGNYYSRRHVSLDPDKDTDYWNFTFDEYGNFDLPAIIDYILKMTGYSKLFYVGHSQGTTQYFSMGSLRPDYNNKIGLGVQLAPVVWMKNFGNPLAVFAARHYEAIKEFLEAAGVKEFFPRDRLVHLLSQFLCEKAPMLCEVVLFIATGYRQGTIDLKDIPVIFGHFPSGCSVKSVVHYTQLIRSGEFQRYDEGTKGNIERYGSPRPPQYNISLVTSPVLLIAGQRDTLSSIADLQILASKLPNLVENYIIANSYWSHPNHIWGNMAPKLIYSKILKYFDKYKLSS